MSGKEDKSEEDKLTFYSLDNNLKQLQWQVVFSFSGTQFNIKNVDTTIDPIIDPIIDPVDDFTIDSTVCYLKLTIDTVKHLSLFHLFLWQHRQGLLFQTSIQLIIIQNTLKKSSTNEQDPVINVSEYWKNLVSLSIQMGFSVYSYQQGEEIKQIKLNKRIEDEIILFKFKYQIIIVSEYSSIDTESLPYCSSVKDKSTQQQKDESKEKTFPQFMPSYLSSTEKQVILQKIGLSSHKLPVYAHLLPMILGYSAYLIYKQMLESNNKVDGQCILISQQIYNNADMKANSQKFFKINNIESQQVCNDKDILANFKNSFELPVHLLEVFEFDQNNKFIFQQMCDVSYMFKAQYFAIFSAFFTLDNAVLSQSSRSGKTVTLHTIFYFNLFSGLKIPILINIGYQKSLKQPLYDRSSIKLEDNLKEIFAFAKDKTIETIFEENLKKGLIIQNYFSILVSKINLFIRYFQQEIKHKKSSDVNLNIFDNYINGGTSFDKFLSISSIDFFDIQDKDYVAANKNLEEQLVLINGSYETLVQEQQNKLKQLQDSYKQIIQKQDYDKDNDKDKDQDQDTDILVLVDECLNQQRDNYQEITGKLVQFTDEYMHKLLSQARSCIGHVVEMLGRSINTEVVEKIQLWLGDKTSIDKNSDKSDIKKKLTDKINQILESDQIEEYFLKFLCYYDLLIGTNAAAILDLIAISSPNFIHVKTSSAVLNSFSEMMADLKKYPNKDVFKQKLYHFLLMLYNPRGMETIFWRNICYAMKLDSQPSIYKGIFSINSKIVKYFTDSPYTFDNLLQKLNSIFNIQFQLNFELIYQEIPIIKHDSFNFLSAGTDLALINFIRQNQFIYTSDSSRGSDEYIQSNILGTSQMHPSYLKQNYYKDMRITTQTNVSMIEQIKDKVKSMSIKDFYLMMIPELAAELQFLCPLICPQIIINKEQNEYLFNSTQLFEYKVNKKEISLNQISSHTQILNSLFILRSGQTVGAKQLVNDLVLLENKSIAVFNTDLHLTSSSSLNRDVVFVLNFLASQKFFVTLIQLSGVSDEAQLSYLCSAGQINCLLQQQNISEISSAILLVASLCRQHPTHIIGLNKFLKQINKYSQYLEIYVNPLLTQYNQQKTLAQVYEQLQSLFQGAFTMFLQKSFDSYWNDGKPKMEVYVKDAVKNASVCFIKLQQLNLLKEDQKLVIVTILDKTKISDQFFNPAPPMPDYLISLFGVSDQEVQDFPVNEILSIQPNQVEGQSVYSINLLMDSGTHDGQEMFKKQKDTGIATCFQVTKEYKQNSMQICLHHQVSPKYGAIDEKKKVYDLNLLSQQLLQKNNVLIQAKQKAQKSKSVLTLAQVTLECQQAELKFNNADKNKITAQLYWRKILVLQYKARSDKIEAVENDENEQIIEAKQLSINNYQKQVIISKAEVDLADQQLTMKTIYLTMAQYKVTYVEKTASLDQQVVDKNITLEEAKKSKQQLEVQNQENIALIDKEIKRQQDKVEKLLTKAKQDKDDIDCKYSEMTNQMEVRQKIQGQEQKILELENEKQITINKISSLSKDIQIATTNIQTAEQDFNVAEQEVRAAEQNLILIQAETNKQLLVLVGKTEKAAETVQTVEEKVNKELQKAEQAYEKAMLLEPLIEAAEKEIDAEINFIMLFNAVQKIQPSLVKQELTLKPGYLSSLIKGKLSFVDTLFNDKEKRDALVQDLITDMEQFKTTLKQILIEISQKLPGDQEIIYNYVNTWNELMSQQKVQDLQQTQGQEDLGTPLINQQHESDVQIFCKFYQELSQIKSSNKNILRLPNYAASHIPLLLKDEYNQRCLENKLLQQSMIAQNQESQEVLIQQIYSWLSNIFMNSEKTKIEYINIITELQNKIKYSDKVCRLVFTVLLEKINQIVVQVKSLLAFQSNQNLSKQNQDQNAVPSEQMETVVNDHGLQQLEKIEQEAKQQQEGTPFINKFFLLDNFYFTNYERQNGSSDLFINYLYNLVHYQNVKETIKQIDKSNQQQKTVMPTQQEDPNVQQADLEQSQTGCYFIFQDIDEKTLEAIFPKLEFEFQNDCYHATNYSTIQDVIQDATIPIKIIKLDKQLGNKHASIIQCTYDPQFSKFGKFYLTDDSKSLFIKGDNIIWISNNFIDEAANAKKFTPQFLFQILKKINTCLIDKAITYKLLDSENTIKQPLEDTDIIGFLLQNHLFPVSIDGTTLIVDQLSDDNKSFKTTKSQQTIKSWFSNYCVKNHGTLIPEVENYIKSFKLEILTAEIAESANLELFDTEMTVEKQIEHMISEARKQANGKEISLKFIDPVTYDIYPGTNLLVEPTVDDVIKMIGRFIFVEFDIYKKTRVEITCIKVE